MQFVRYDRGDTGTWGVLKNRTVHSLAAVPGEPPSLRAFGNASYRARVGRLVEENALPTVSLDDVDLFAPVPRPGKLVCVGLNYHDHAAELDEEIPETPLLFGKASTAVTHPDAPIRIPPGIASVDWEVELAVVVGRTAHRVVAADASDYVAGYTVVNDVSGRDAQFADGQWYRGKSFDTFAPMGPTLTVGDGFDPNGADVATRVDGVTKQDSNTEQFIFDAWELVEFVSHAMTLEPGDVISTGTPGGVGTSREPPEYLAPGDTVEVEVDGIGTLRNSVVDGR